MNTLGGFSIGAWMQIIVSKPGSTYHCENMLWVTKYVRDYSSIGCDDIKNAIQGTYQLKKYALIY